MPAVKPFLAAAILLLSLFVASPASAIGETPDTSFGSNGIARITPGFGDAARALFVQPDGKIVLIGYFGSATQGWDYTAVRYSAAGVLDTSFGVNGVFQRHIRAGHDVPRGAIMQADGKFVIGGDIEDTPGNYRVVAMRITANGALDTSFGSNGYWENTTPSTFGGITQQADGKILIASNLQNTRNATVTRLSANGAVDSSFGTAGVSAFNSSTDYREIRSLSIDSSNRILVGGQNFLSPNRRLMVARLSSNGVLDSGFGSGGMVSSALGSADDQVRAVLPVADGYIVAGYSKLPSGKYAIHLRKLRLDGTTEPSFGTSGTVSWSSASTADDYAFRATLGSDGRIYTVGYSNAGSNIARVVVFNADGTPYSSFGNGGTATGFVGFYEAVGFTADGRLLAAGGATTNGIDGIAVQRFHTPAYSAYLAAQPSASPSSVAQIAETGSHAQSLLGPAAALLLLGAGLSGIALARRRSTRPRD